MEATIDCRELQSPEEFHAAIKSALRLPDYYGANLDALYDCLTEIGKRTTLNLIGVEPMIRQLGSFGRAAINVIARAERENGEFLTVNMY